MEREKVGRGGTQDAANQKEKNSTVQLKEGEEKQIQYKSLSPQSISSAAEEREKRGSFQKSGQAIQPIPRSTKSAEVHRALSIPLKSER